MDAHSRRRLHSAFHNGLPFVDLSKAWTCHWNDLKDYQVTPSSRVSDDEWIIPPEWCSPTQQKPSDRILKFTSLVSHASHDDFDAGIVRRLKRLAVLDRFQTLRSGGRTGSPPDPSSWVKRYQQCIRVVRHSLEHLRPAQQRSSCPDGVTFFSSLSGHQFSELKKLYPNWGSGSIARLNGLYAAGLFDDWPASDVAPHVCATRVGSRASEGFNDIAFSEIIRAALWLNSIQAEVLQAFMATKDVDEGANGERHRQIVFERRRHLVRSWESPALQTGMAFPFWLELQGEAMKSERFVSWPLETVRGLKSLLSRCQTANMILILGSTGMRIGELADLKRCSLTKREGRWFLSGSSFKSTDAFSGEPRQWPLPNAAVQAFEAQRELSLALGGSNEQLWIPVGREIRLGGTPTFQSLLRYFGRTTGLRDGSSLAELDGDITPHRFRYSVARLVALSLTGASQVLFDVLGHDDVKTTLGYALQDPDLHVDINKIRAEVKAIRFRRAFDEADENSGPAAEIIKRAKADLLARSGRDELETDEITVAAAILGDAEMVKEGVMCTAQPLERGACSSSLGLRDYGACDPRCLHRLEMAAAKQDRRAKIVYILDILNVEDKASRVYLINQLLANFIAFPVLLDEFENDPRLIAALNGCLPESFASLQPTLRLRCESLSQKVNT